MPMGEEREITAEDGQAVARCTPRVADQIARYANLRGAQGLNMAGAANEVGVSAGRGRQYERWVTLVRQNLQLPALPSPRRTQMTLGGMTNPRRADRASDGTAS
jgi:hypothetical protein